MRKYDLMQNDRGIKVMLSEGEFYVCLERKVTLAHKNKEPPKDLVFRRYAIVDGGKERPLKSSNYVVLTPATVKKGRERLERYEQKKANEIQIKKQMEKDLRKKFYLEIKNYIRKKNIRPVSPNNYTIIIANIREYLMEKLKISEQEFEKIWYELDGRKFTCRYREIGYKIYGRGLGYDERRNVCTMRIII